jgi:LCP family protein required for cell wall assembly
MLSIPRDLWVSIPDYGVYDRINTAHFRGDGDQYPGGGGPALAMNTVQHNFGRPVDYYASLNFQAFTGVIDQIGCIPITVSETINDEKYPDGANGYDPFYIEAGNYCLEGETLLKYARTRATYGGDFDRAARQQQVIYAIRDHVLSTDQLPLLIARAPELYGTVADGVRTNLSLPQMIALARLVAEIPNGNICSAVITGEYVELETLSDGSQVLIPDRDKVRSLVNQVFDGEGECAAGTLSLADQALSEGATISILNGTRQEGLATATRDIITGGGLSVAFIGNAERFDYTQTQILSYTGKTATAQYIASLLGLPPSSVISSRDGTEYDILVILGEDYLP